MIFPLIVKMNLCLARRVLLACLLCLGWSALFAQETNSAAPLKMEAELRRLPPASTTSTSDTIPDKPVDAGLSQPAQFPDVIGEGDQLLITVFGQPDMSADVLVGASGIITLPLVGVIEVKGKTASEVATQFARKLEQGQYLLDPKVSVKVAQQISRSFSVLGEVLRPGRYPLQGPVSMLEALSLAGGTTTRADKSLRILRRTPSAGATTAQEVLSLKLDLEEGKNQAALMQSVLPNDVLIIGQQKNFYVYGEVRRPGMYPVENDLNIMRVLAIGGGVTDRGSTSRMLIYRKSDGGNIQAVPANLTDPVLPGDVVFVNERIF